MERIYTIKLDNGATYQARGDEALGLERNDLCVIRKDFYFDFGNVQRAGVPLDPGKGGEMPSIQRKADENDRHAISESAARCRGALRSAQQMVDHLGLEMKLLNAHYTLDGKLLTIQFTADGRVDFRELVKELSRALNTRIELRQIGVRDESAIHGGISVCGQVLCCCRFLKEFSSINVRMAKDQDLSLTPATISGVCGRLKCCLKYEHEGYLELEKTMPRRGEWCECPSGRGRISDRNLLTQEVTIQLEGGTLCRFPVAEIKIVPSERPPRPAPGPRRGPDKEKDRDRNDRAQSPGNRPPRRDRRGDRRPDRPDRPANPAAPEASARPQPPAAETTPAPEPPAAE